MLVAFYFQKEWNYDDLNFADNLQKGVMIYYYYPLKVLSMPI